MSQIDLDSDDGQDERANRRTMLQRRALVQQAPVVKPPLAPDAPGARDPVLVHLIRRTWLRTTLGGAETAPYPKGTKHVVMRWEALWMEAREQCVVIGDAPQAAPVAPTAVTGPGIPELIGDQKPIAPILQEQPAQPRQPRKARKAKRAYRRKAKSAPPAAEEQAIASPQAETVPA